jgi:hypothetical protein
MKRASFSGASYGFRPFVVTSALGLLSVLVAACTSESRPTPEATEDETSALGEQFCGWNAITSPSIGVSQKPVVCDPQYVPNQDVWGITASGSAPSTYGSTSCANQFVLEVQDPECVYDKTSSHGFWAGRGLVNFTPGAGYELSTLNATTCPNTYATFGVYFRDFQTHPDIPSTYYLVGNLTIQGSWDGSACHFHGGADSGGVSYLYPGEVVFPQNKPIWGLRIAGSYYQTSVNKGATVVTTMPFTMQYVGEGIGCPNATLANFQICPGPN